MRTRISHDDLERLQHKCKGEESEDLYSLVGSGKHLEYAELIEKLKGKKNAWSKMSGKSAKLELIELALKLLKEPADQKDYDLFLRKGSERQPERPEQQRPPLEIGVGKLLVEISLWTIKLLVEISVWIIKFFAELADEVRKLLVGISVWTVKFFAKLAVVAVGISMLVLLVAGLLNRLDLSTITWSRSGAPSGASTSNEGETSRPSASSRETASSTGAERSGSTAPPATAANRTGEPNASGTRSTATPARVRPDLDTSSTRAAQPEAMAVAAPSGENAEERPARSDPLPPNRDTTSARVAESETMVAVTPNTAVTPEANAEEPARPAPPSVVEPVRVGGNVPHPSKVWNVTPEYPRLARLRRIEGTVILEVTVDRQGEVSNVAVLRSPEGLGEAAVDAVRQWRYEPTIVNGRPVSIIFTETVRFEI